MLTGAARGARGVLVPPTVLAQLPSLDVTWTTARPKAEQLQLVGVRLDPCTGQLAGQARDCRAEVRLIFQIFAGEFAHDGAVHTFYAITDAELDAFVDELVTAREQAGGVMPRALDIHPVLAEQGLTGAYGGVLKDAILRAAGAQNLTRVAVSNRTGIEPTGPWDFALFDVDNGVPQAKRIATTGASRQRIAGSAITNPSTVPAAQLAMLDPARDNVSDAAAVEAQLTLEDPRTHSSETVACIECHRATVMLRNRVTPFLGLAGLGYQSRVGTAALGVLDDSDPVINFHMFSYFGRRPNVSQRVGNEVAASVERLRQRRR